MFRKSDLRKTTFYQEVKEEIQEEVKQEVEQKLKQSISRLLAMGLTPEQIAQALDTSVEFVRQVVQTHNSGS